MLATRHKVCARLLFAEVSTFRDRYYITFPANHDDFRINASALIVIADTVDTVTKFIFNQKRGFY